MRPFEAALKGSREIGFTIVSITFSLIAVFIPVLLMGGMVGRVFREFAVSIVGGDHRLRLRVADADADAVRARAQAAIIRRGGKAEFRAARLRALFERDAAMPTSGRSTACCALQVDHADGDAGHHRRHDLALYRRAEGLLPDRRHRLRARHHRGQYRHRLRRDDRAPAQGRRHHAHRSGGGLRQFHRRRRRARTRCPTAAACWSRSSRATSATSLAINHGAAAARTPTSSPACEIFFQPIQNINLGGKLAKSQYQYTLQSNDTATLYRIAPELRDKIAKIPGLLDVTTDLYIKNPQITIDVDREKAAVYGVTVDQVRQELYNAFGTRQVATIYTPANDYQVILETLAGIPQRAERSRPALSQDHERHDGAAVGGDAFRADGRAAAGQPPGPAAGGDHLVQPGARTFRSARRSTRSRSSSARSGCRPPSPPASRAPRRCSRIHCAGRAS